MFGQLAGIYYEKYEDDMKNLIGASLLFALLWAVSPHAYAASNVPTVTVSPFLQNVQVQENDQTKPLDLTLLNTSNQTQTFHLSVLDFGALNETGGVAFASSDSSTLIKKYGLSTWLKLDNDSITLAPGQKTKVGAVINNDSTMSPGGHYAAVIASLDSENGSKGNTVDIKQQLSALIMVTKTGGEKYDLSLNNTKFKTSWWHLPTSLVLRFKNPGNVQVVPRGMVKIVAPGGAVVSQAAINEGSGFILPETFRQFPVELQNVGRPKLWPTTYQLQVIYRYDGLEQFAIKTYKVRFINLPVLLVAGLLVLAMAAATMTIIKKLRKRKRR